ncbi:uncharacterized protein [Primulina huaijiensis]|uniref:uncharacterized protein n=1 Tax=Primulina huaijiensis TaxID=1492673 RepID=UPI003CC79160
MHRPTTRRTSILLPPRFLPAFLFFSVGCICFSAFPNSPSFCAPSSFKSSCSARTSRPTGRQRQPRRVSIFIPPLLLPDFLFSSVGCICCSVIPNSPSFCATFSFKASCSARSSRPTGKKRHPANCSYYEAPASYPYGKLVLSCCIQYESSSYKER